MLNADETELISKSDGNVSYQPDYFLSTSSMPLKVAGVVAPVDEVVLSAQISGNIERLNVKTGDVVSAGDSVMVQATPIADAKLRLAESAGGLDVVQSELEEFVRSNDYKKAEVRFYSAEDVARLKTVGLDNSESIAVGNLLNTLTDNVTTLLTAINYINNNREIFSAAGLGQYESLVSGLYGVSPSYFQGAMQKRGFSAEAILQELDRIRSDEGKSVVEVQSVALLMKEHLAATLDLLTTSESDIFDKNKVTSTDAFQNEYLSLRSSITSSLSSLSFAKPELQSVVDEFLLVDENNHSSIKLSELDKKQAEEYKDFSKLISSKVLEVANANADLAWAEKNLGNTKAPFSGQVSKLHVSAGEYVLAGEPLLILVNDDLLEVVVKVPLEFLSSLEIGLPFFVDGEEVGFVSEFSRVASQGSGEVVVTLTDKDMLAGNGVSGVIQLPSASDLFQVERKYLAFDNEGPYLQYKNGVKTRVEILSDLGDSFFVRVADYLAQPLQTNGSIGW